jgi:type I restriction enzyme S subunit
MVEQRQIGNVLSTLDKAIEKTESLITKYQQIKAGLMHDLFTRGVTPDGKLRTPREQAPELYHETPIGWIPKEWVFGSLATFLSGGPKNGYSPHEIDEWCGCYALGLGCLTSDGFRPVQLKMVDGGVARASDAFLSDGDLLVSRSNTSELVGLCGIYRDVGFPCIYPDLVMRIRPNALVYSEYLEQLLLNSDTRRRLTALAVGTSASMVKLNAKTLLSLSIALPSDLSEQRRILEIVSPSRELIKNLEAERNKLQYEKIGLMQDLLTGRVRVS